MFKVLYLSGLKLMAAILNKEAKLKIVGGVILRSSQQDLDPASFYITSILYITSVIVVKSGNA